MPKSSSLPIDSVGADQDEEEVSDPLMDAIQDPLSSVPANFDVPGP